METPILSWVNDGKWDLLQLHSPPSTLRWVVHSEETEGDVNLREPRSLGHYFKYNPALICYKPIKCSNFNHKLKVTSNPISPKTKWRILKTHETRCLVLFCPSKKKNNMGGKSRFGVPHAIYSHPIESAMASKSNCHTGDTMARASLTSIQVRPPTHCGAPKCWRTMDGFHDGFYVAEW